MAEKLRERERERLGIFPMFSHILEPNNTILPTQLERHSLVLWQPTDVSAALKYPKYLYYKYF